MESRFTKKDVKITFGGAEIKSRFSIDVATKNAICAKIELWEFTDGMMILKHAEGRLRSPTLEELASKEKDAPPLPINLMEYLVNPLKIYSLKYE